MSTVKLKITANVWIMIMLFQAFFFFVNVGGQTETNSSAINPLRISVSNISIDQTRTFRGLTGYFPTPVLSTISIIDYKARLMTGLADTARWLGPEDTTEVGRPINAIWRHLNEYHSDNPEFPADTDVFNQSPLPLITEVRKNVPIPTNTMLIMDVSSSMAQELEDAKNGVRTYVELLRSIDRVGLAQFDSSIVRFQKLTADKDSVLAAIDAAELGRGTAIFDPLMLAVQEIKLKKNRCGIIVYTDGQDNSSTTTHVEVIDSARAYNIPIFTIALGNDTREDELEQIAQRTGGIFFKAATAAEMSQVFKDLSNVILNYYVLAHTTTDPERNGTWRTLEVSVKIWGKEGIGKGEYFVPGIDAPAKTDIAVKLTSVTDTTITRNNRQQNAVFPGDSYRYDIRLSNAGPELSDTISIHQTLPDSVYYLSSTLQPVMSDQDSLEWTIPSLAPGQDSTFSVFVQLDSNYSDLSGPLLSEVRLSADNDSTAQNNADSDTVIVLQKLRLKNYDLAIFQSALTDTTVELDGKIEQAVMAGDSILYSLKIMNNGPTTAFDILLQNISADSVNFTEFSLNPYYSSDDTLFWRFDSLSAQDSILIAMTAFPADSLPEFPFEIINTAEVVAERDTFVQNNTSLTTVYGIERTGPALKRTNLIASIQSQTERFKVIEGDTVRAVFPGDEFGYEISMKNVGEHAAENAKFTHTLPDSVTFRRATLPPEEIDGKALTWNVGNFAPNAEFNPAVFVELSGDIPRSVERLISWVEVTAENDSLPADNFAADTAYVVFPDTAFTKKIDLQVTQSIISDTTIVIEGDTLPAVIQGDFYAYSVTIQNLGPVTARNFSLHEVVPGSVTLFEFNRMPDGQQADTLTWHFDSLNVDEEKVVSFEVQSGAAYAAFPHKLNHHSFVSADRDSVPDNNSSQAEIYVIQKTGTGDDFTDVSVNLFSTTATTIERDGRTVNAVRANELFQYEIDVVNHGLFPALDVNVTQALPDFVDFLSADVPGNSSGNSVSWQFDQLNPGADSTITVTVKASETLPAGVSSLVSDAEISAVNDSSFANNADADTVYVISIQPSTADLALTQAVVPHIITVIENDTVPAVLVGDSFQYSLTIRNEGPGTAYNFLLADSISPRITPSDFSLAPAFVSDSLILWQLDSLSSGNSVVISFETIIEDAPFLPYPIFNPAYVSAANDPLPDNNLSATLIYAVEQQAAFCDIAVSQTAITDSFAVIGNDTVRFAKKGETYGCEITLSNNSMVTARNVTVSDRFPDSVVVSNISPSEISLTGDSLVWRPGNLPPESSIKLRFEATVSQLMPMGKNALINRVIARAENEKIDALSDNVSVDTVYSVVKPIVSQDYTPIIQADPPFVEVGGEVAIRVQVLLPVESWDIWIYLADGTIITDFADDYIESTVLTPNEWFDIDKKFTDVQLFTLEETERITFELRTTDVFGELRTAETFILVQSNNNFNLDRNVYTANASEPLAINFKLSSNRVARLDLFDLTGAKVTKITEGPYRAGWNTYHWDGRTDEGQFIGNGLYFITIESGDYRAMKKVMVVQ